MPVTVHFATNRVLTGPADDWRSYGDDIIGPDPGNTLYATAFVERLHLDADRQGAITGIHEPQRGGFGPQAVGDLGHAGQNLLVFLHGFDNSFENAITRAAFNREWLAQAGVPAADTSVIAFSWPSAGRLVSVPLWRPYKSDQVLAGRSAPHIVGFLRTLVPIIQTARADGRRVFLLAHSMGAWALQAAIDAWFAQSVPDALLFDEVFLAAADEVWTTFEYPQLARLSGLHRLTRRISILFNRHDQILRVSDLAISHIRRLGQDGPEDRDNPGRFPPDLYRMMDCSGFHDYAHLEAAASHQYYRKSPGVRQLVAQAMAEPTAVLPAAGAQ